jgi:hypothetical protein
MKKGDTPEASTWPEEWGAPRRVITHRARRLRSTSAINCTTRQAVLTKCKGGGQQF